MRNLDNQNPRVNPGSIKTYAYVGKTSSGQTAKGTLRAGSEEEARKRLLAMGVAADIIGEQSAGRPAAQVPLFVEKVDDADGEEEEEEEEEEMPERIRNDIQATTAAFQKVHEYPPSPPPPSIFSRRPRKQLIFMGESATVMNQAKPVLDAGGKVVHAVIHPDAKGKMQVLLVIETGDEQ